MKKIAKRIIIVLGILFLLLKGMEWVIEYRFQNLINRSPERKYNISYEDFDLHTFFKGVTLQEVRIVPVSIDSGTVIIGSVDYARLEGLVWYQLMFERRLNIDGILFSQPTFNVTMSDHEKKKTSGKGMQDLFKDIISRARLKRFEIDQGSVILMDPGNERIRGRMSNLNLKATEIKTDSVIFSHLIPFKLGSFEASIDSLSFNLNEYTHLSSGRLAYSKEGSMLTLQDLQMKYLIDWKEVSRKIGKQTDLMEVSLKELAIERLEASNSFYSDLDIEAHKIVLSDLVFKDYRDKNMPRPPDAVKPLFKGMVDAIPITLNVDTIQLDNVDVLYTELGEGKSMAGAIRFEDINGSIIRLTTLAEQQKSYQSFEANLTARINGVADLSFDLTVPYDREEFVAIANIGSMDLTQLNETALGMAGVEVVSGDVEKIYFEMRAAKQSSHNKMQFDYENLKIHVLKEGKDHHMKNQGLMSSIANSAIRNHNTPSHGKYLTADYVSQRNIYRGPFNFMWHSLADGMLHIVPGKMVQDVIGVDKETKEEKKKARKKEKKKNKKNHKNGQ